MNFAKYRVQLSTEKKYSSKYEYKYEYEYSIPVSLYVNLIPSVHIVKYNYLQTALVQVKRFIVVTDICKCMSYLIAAASRAGSGKSACMCRLIRAFATRMQSMDVGEGWPKDFETVFFLKKTILTTK